MASSGSVASIGNIAANGNIGNSLMINDKFRSADSAAHLISRVLLQFLGGDLWELNCDKGPKQAAPGRLAHALQPLGAARK